MKQKTRCANPKCESHKNDQHLFTVTVTIDDDADPVENLKRIPAEDQTCAHCGSHAELVEIKAATTEEQES